MSRFCAMCLKGPKKAANRSHSNVKTLRVQRANLQTVNGVLLCTKCIKTLNKQAA